MGKKRKRFSNHYDKIIEQNLTLVPELIKHNKEITNRLLNIIELMECAKTGVGYAKPAKNHGG